MAANTPKFDLVRAEETDFYNYTTHIRENFDKIDHAIKDSGTNNITATLATDVPLKITGHAAQSTNFFEVNLSDGSDHWTIDKNGRGGNPRIWTAFDPLFKNTTIGAPAGTLCTGVNHRAAYRMIDARTMAVRISLYPQAGWSSGGGQGFLAMTLPTGFQIINNSMNEQFLSCRLYDPDQPNRVLMGMCHIRWDIPDLIMPYFPKRAVYTAFPVETQMTRWHYSDNPQDTVIKVNGNFHAWGVLEVEPEA